MTSQEPFVVWHEHSVSREDRERVNGHQGCVLWFTGLSGSGKSTIANQVDFLLNQRAVHTFLLDGDNVRHGLCAGPAKLEAVHGESFARRFGLGFGAEDREENIRRVGSVAQLFVASGLIVLTAFVSPYRRDRLRVRSWIESQGRPGDFIEVFVDTPIELCEQRDPKGLYKQAREGKIANFTGISDPYEPPENADLVLDTASRSPLESAEQVIAFLQARGVLP